jgi:hypothetical protein
MQNMAESKGQLWQQLLDAERRAKVAEDERDYWKQRYEAVETNLLDAKAVREEEEL